MERLDLTGFEHLRMFDHALSVALDYRLNPLCTPSARPDSRIFMEGCDRIGEVAQQFGSQFAALRHLCKERIRGKPSHDKHPFDRNTNVEPQSPVRIAPDRTNLAIKLWRGALIQAKLVFANRFAAFCR